MAALITCAMFSHHTRIFISPLFIPLTLFMYTISTFYAVITLINIHVRIHLIYLCLSKFPFIFLLICLSLCLLLHLFVVYGKPTKSFPDPGHGTRGPRHQYGCPFDRVHGESDTARSAEPAGCRTDKLTATPWTREGGRDVGKVVSRENLRHLSLHRGTS